MVIFLLVAVPLFYLIMDSLLSNFHGKIDDSYKPFVYGLICFAISVVIYNIIRLTAIFPTYTVSGLYFYYIMHDNLIQFLLAVASYLLVFGFSDFESNHHAVNRLFSFLCGYYCMWSVNDVIINYGWFNSYLLLIIPIQRIGLIAAFTFVFSEALKQTGVRKVLLYLTCLVLPFITAAGALCWRLSLPIPMVIITAGLPALSGFLLYKKLQPREPEMKISLSPGNEIN
ncbi:MAG: hypothetical protein JEZ04_01355 [Spirochaetales bacterium]|nr:hypothetical protein [Spirochaetales bacterium]